jgi:hypothetical protein
MSRLPSKKKPDICDGGGTAPSPLEVASAAAAIAAACTAATATLVLTTAGALAIAGAIMSTAMRRDLRARITAGATAA